MFADLSLNFPFIKIVGEIGQVSGGTIDTYNTFWQARRRLTHVRLGGIRELRIRVP